MISRTALQAVLGESRMSRDGRDSILELWDRHAELVQRMGTLTASAASAESLRIKLRKAHAELERRRRHDVEIAHHLPSIVARLSAIAEDARTATAPQPNPVQNWEDDPSIDWTGITR